MRLPTRLALWQISEFQRTKAIHNYCVSLECFYLVVANIRISKNKSNSQPIVLAVATTLSCGKYQNFKEQKQFTTYSCIIVKYIELWQISEFQRTKAIHNLNQLAPLQMVVVANIRISKNKSNSQLTMNCIITMDCCGKYQNFKEQKQFTTSCDLSYFFYGCGKYQKLFINFLFYFYRHSSVRSARVKEQKQFTTELGTSSEALGLWQISEIQRTKAIHNTCSSVKTLVSLWQISEFQRTKKKECCKAKK